MQRTQTEVEYPESRLQNPEVHANKIDKVGSSSGWRIQQMQLTAFLAKRIVIYIYDVSFSFFCHWKLYGKERKKDDFRMQGTRDYLLEVKMACTVGLGIANKNIRF